MNLSRKFYKLKIFNEKKISFNFNIDRKEFGQKLGFLHTKYRTEPNVTASFPVLSVSVFSVPVLSVYIKIKANFFFIQNFLLLFTNANFLRVASFWLAFSGLMTFPAIENLLSLAAELAGKIMIWAATLDSIGYLCEFPVQKTNGLLLWGIEVWYYYCSRHEGFT